MDDFFCFVVTRAALAFVSIMLYVVISILGERRPILSYVIATFSFILALLAMFLLGRVICHVRTQV